VAQPAVLGGFDPVQRLHGVFVGGGEAVLRGEAVVDRNHDGLRGVGHSDAEVVEVSGGCTVEEEAPAVVEDDEG